MPKTDKYYMYPKGYEKWKDRYPNGYKKWREPTRKIIRESMKELRVVKLSKEQIQKAIHTFDGKDIRRFSVKQFRAFCKIRGINCGVTKTAMITCMETIIANADQEIMGEEEHVHLKLREAGIQDPHRVNTCLKQGIWCGYYHSKDGSLDVNKVIVDEKCDHCGKDIVIKVKDILYMKQQNIGHDYECGSQGGWWKCKGGGKLCRTYLTELCLGSPHLDASGGKFHHHCDDCPGFGYCWGDYRSAHCFRCGQHYFGGGLSQFKCQMCFPGSVYDF